MLEMAIAPKNNSMTLAGCKRVSDEGAPREYHYSQSRLLRAVVGAADGIELGRVSNHQR